MFGILLGLSVAVSDTPDLKEVHVVRSAYVCTAIADSSVRWEVSLLPRMGKDRIRIQSKFGPYSVEEDRLLNPVYSRSVAGAEVAETVLKSGDKHQFQIDPSMIEGQREGKMTALMDPTYEAGPRGVEHPDEAEEVDFFCARRLLP